MNGKLSTLPGNAEKVWSDAQEILRKLLTPDLYNMWFSNIRAGALDDHSITLEVANSICQIWVQDNYKDLLRKALMHATGQELEIKFEVSPTLAANASHREVTPAHSRLPEESHAARAASPKDLGFNPRSTFDSFVVGNNNNFAHAAAMAVGQTPGRSYNPLFLYGGVGLGKTHLLHAIGQHVAGSKKGARVAYVSSEKFTNEYIDAIQNSQLVRFRKRYRQTDVLLIDDIQFLAGKERIQEEFFHTFNALHEAHKQIVLTCDRPANEIQNLENRLVSRFEWGLVTDLQPPDVEMRLAILHKRSEERRVG